MNAAIAEAHDGIVVWRLTGMMASAELMALAWEGAQLVHATRPHAVIHDWTGLIDLTTRADRFAAAAAFAGWLGGCQPPRIVIVAGCDKRSMALASEYESYIGHAAYMEYASSVPAAKALIQKQRW